jgi:universal stress protein E
MNTRTHGQYGKLMLVADAAMQRTPAFERAVALARATDAALHIVIIDHVSAIEALSAYDAKTAEDARAAWLQSRRSWLASQAQLLQAFGLKVTTDALWAKSVRTELLAYITEYTPDLVIKDVHHESAIRRLLLTPLDWHLLRDSAAPVLLVNTLAHALPRRIVAAVDVAATAEGTDFNDAILKAALGLAIQCDAELHVVTSVDFPMTETEGFAGLMTWTPEMFDTMRKNQAEALAELARTRSVPAERTQLLTGPAASAIASFAESAHTDVIVVGTHRRDGLDRLLMGSVTESIVHTAPCDVLVIAP